MSEGQPLSEDDRWPWLGRIRGHIEASWRDAKSLIVACSALRETYRAILKGACGRVDFVLLRGDARTIAARLERRAGHFMNPDLLESQFRTLEPPLDALQLDIEMAPEILVQRILESLDLRGI